MCLTHRYCLLREHGTRRFILLRSFIFLRSVFAQYNVVGFDVVELCPNEKERASDFSGCTFDLSVDDVSIF